MIRTQVYIPDDLHRELKLLAQVERVKYSHLIREGAKEVIKKRAKRKASKGWKDFIGAYKGKVKTNATKDIHDYYLHDAI